MSDVTSALRPTSGSAPAAAAPEVVRPSVATTRVEVGNPTSGARPAAWSRLHVPRSVQRYYGPLFLLAVWAVVTHTGLVGPRTFPTPDAVAITLFDMTVSGELVVNVWASLQRVLIGLGLGVTGGITLALIGGLTRRGENLVDSTMEIFKAIPNFALIPLLILWMGIGEEPKVILIAMGTGMPIYINTYGGIRNVDRDLVEAVQTFGVDRSGLIRNVILPGSVPGFLVGLRVATASAWLSLIFAETINAQRGIGALMTWAQHNFRLEMVVAILVVYAVIGLLSYAGVRALERRLLAWRRGYEAVD